MNRWLCSIAKPDVSNIPARRTFVSHPQDLKASAELIADLWYIGIKKAKSPLEAATQRGTRSAILPHSCMYRSDRVYSWNILNARFAIDTIFSDIRSLNQNACAQVFSHKVGLSAIYPTRAGSGYTIGQSYKYFCHDYGVLEHLTFNGAIAKISNNTLFMKTINKYGTRYHVSSPRRPNENPTEGAIREIKNRWYRIMLNNKVPNRLWDYGLIWIIETGNLSDPFSRYA